MKTENLLLILFGLLLLLAPKKSRRYIRSRYKRARSMKWKRNRYRKTRKSISRKSFLRGLKIGKMKRRRYKLA